MKGAHMVEGEALERAREPLHRAAVGVGVAEQQAIGDDADDRLRLIAALRVGGLAIGQHALPVGVGEARAHQHVARDVQRREEGVVRRLDRELRAVAAAPQPEVGAQALELVGQREGVARAGPLVEHLRGQRRQARQLRRIVPRAAADHERRRDDRRHLAPHGHHLEAVRQREAIGGRRDHARQRPDGRRRGHRRRRLDHALTGSGSVCSASRFPASARANASRTDAQVASA